MTETGSVRRLSGNVRPQPSVSAMPKGQWDDGAARNGLIRFNPFHMEGRNQRVGAKSEVRVDE